MKRRRRLRRPVRLAITVIVLFVLGGFLASLLRHHAEDPRPLEGSPSGNSTAADGDDPPDSVYRIVIDPGHGGKDPGSEGSSGRWEKDSNLSLAMKIYDLLRQDPAFAPRLTRSDDTFVELADRAEIAEHIGTRTCCCRSTTTRSRIRASAERKRTISMPTGCRSRMAIHQQVVAALGFPDRGVKEEQLKVLALSQMPAVLVEPGLSHESRRGIRHAERGRPGEGGASDRGRFEVLFAGFRNGCRYDDRRGLRAMNKRRCARTAY